MPVSLSTPAHGLEDASPDGAPATRSSPSSKTKGIRNQNACDACRDKKVKCFSVPGGTQCYGCLTLGTDCVHEKPRKKRGPPRRVRGPSPRVPSREPEGSGEQATGSPLQPLGTSSYHQSSSVSTGLSPYVMHLDSPEVVRPQSGQSCQLLSLFASADTIAELLNEWFDKIHPIAPILLRRRFFRKLKNGEADTDPIFCGLVVSVCCATLATLPQAHQTSLSVPSCLDFIEKHKLLAFNFGEVSYTLEWCTAMYNIGMAISATSSQGLSDVHGFHAISQAAAATTYLLYYGLGSLSHVDQQLLKRLFWLLFAAAKSGDMFGRITVGFETMHNNWDLLRPTSLSDNQLDPDESADKNSPWHGDDTSYVPGLNSLSELFLIWHQSRLSPPGSDPAVVLGSSMDQIQRIIDNLPPELRWRGGLSRHGPANEGHSAQIANIFVTSFHLRSNLVQKYGNREAIVLEHQRIVDDLLEILYHLPQCVFNANGSSVVPKIRDIGAVYLEHYMSADNPNNDEAKEKMEKILQKLNDLDCWSGLGPGWLVR